MRKPNLTKRENNINKILDEFADKLFNELLELKKQHE